MVLKRVCILFLLLLPLVVSAQVEEVLEQWVEETDDSQAAGEMSDQLKQLQDKPVNLNDTLALEEVPFLTPFQRKALRNYIILYGQMLSLKELCLVPGFDSGMVELLRPFVMVAPYAPPRRWHLAEGHHAVVAALGGTVEQATGYTNGRYEGDNLHALFSYTYNLHNHINVRLVADKDPTEAWGKDNFVGYHVMVNEVGFVERAIVGRYNLQFGQGLTLWTGLRPFNLMGASPVRFGGGIRQAVAFYEEGYQEGLAAKVKLGGGWHLAGFASRVDQEWLAGTHLGYRKGNLIVGLTTAYSRLDSVLEVRDYVYNQNRFQGDWQFNAGIDATWQWRRLLLFGEASVGENGAPAAIGGLALRPDNDNRLGVTIRYYDSHYHNRHAQGYAVGGTQGEVGITLDAETRMPFKTILLGSLDLHRFPAMRYGSYMPSSGAWLRLQLSRPLGKRVTASVRYTYRYKERNVPNVDSTVYLGEQTMRRQLQGEVRASLGSWTLVSRAVYAHFDGESGALQKGGLVSAGARYSYDRLQASAALAYFDVDGYYARIYFSENNLQYAWYMPALYGRGLRCHVLIRYAVSNRLTVAGKYAVSHMPGQESIGSGDALTEGPWRQTWMLQMRWHF